MNKKTKVIVIVVVAIIAIALIVVLIRWYKLQLEKIYFPGKSSEGFEAPNDSTVINALRTVIRKFDRETGETVERMYRWETKHMKSGGFKNTNAPGMENTRNLNGALTPYPYGWSSLRGYWDSHPEYAPIGVWESAEGGTGKLKPFLIFPTTEAGMMTLAYWLQSHRPGNWFSDSDQLGLQTDYENKISTVTPSITNNLA